MFNESIYDALETLNHELASMDFDHMETREDYLADRVSRIVSNNYDYSIRESCCYVY